jgi:hypothetical protein
MRRMDHQSGYYGQEQVRRHLASARERAVMLQVPLSTWADPDFLSLRANAVILWSD